VVRVGKARSLVLTAHTIRAEWSATEAFDDRPTCGGGAPVSLPVPEYWANTDEKGLLEVRTSGGVRLLYDTTSEASFNQANLWVVMGESAGGSCQRATTTPGPTIWAGRCARWT
jgi:hypothetical protein